jgi:hypothetical protein
MTRRLSARTASVTAALGIALGAGVLAASGTLGHDAAAAAGPRTLTYTATVVPAEAGGIDTGPKGLSVGDTIVNVAALTRAGKPAGRVHIVETVLDKAHQGTSQAFTIFVAGGTVEAFGGGVNLPIPGAPQPPQDQRAVIGGTGAYAGASGTLTVVPVGDTTTRFVLRLR